MSKENKEKKDKKGLEPLPDEEDFHPQEAPGYGERFGDLYSPQNKQTPPDSEHPLDYIKRIMDKKDKKREEEKKRGEE